MTDADTHTPTAAQVAAVRRACMAAQRLDPSCRYPECSCHGMLAVHTAAPELLAALKAMPGNSHYGSLEIEPGEVLPPMWHRICMPTEEALDMARAAIAKAEGKS